MEKKKSKLQWHPAFCSATELELREDRENLVFYREYPLSKQPLKIDMMVIKKKPGVKIKNEIGHIFMTHNIIEYKSPDDDLNIDDYYKALAYVSLYKANGKRVDEIPSDEISLTLARDTRPDKLFKTLEATNHRIIQKSKGIYYIEGDASFPRQQVIVTSEFEGSHYILKMLSKNFTLEDGRKAMEQIELLDTKEDFENRDSVFEVGIIANSQIFNLLKEENTMCEAFFELFKNEIEAKIIAAENIVRTETETRVRLETEEKIRESETRARESETRARESEERIKELEAELARLRKVN